MGQHHPCDAPMESPDSALFEGIGSSVPKTTTVKTRGQVPGNVHRFLDLVLIL